MKELIVDYKERAERCARERITQENKYHEKVDQVSLCRWRDVGVGCCLYT